MLYLIFPIRPLLASVSGPRAWLLLLHTVTALQLPCALKVSRPRALSVHGTASRQPGCHGFTCRCLGMSSKDSRHVPSSQHRGTGVLPMTRPRRGQAQPTRMLVCWGWGDKEMVGPQQSRADPGSSSGLVTARRVVLGKTLLPSGTELPQGKSVSLPRWAGAPGEAVSWAEFGRGTWKVGVERLLLQGAREQLFLGKVPAGGHVPWQRPSARGGGRRGQEEKRSRRALPDPQAPRPAIRGLRAARGQARSSLRLLGGGLQRGNHRTRVLLNQGNDTHRRQRAGGGGPAALAWL